MVVAVLALQGAFLEHEQMLKKLGAEVFEIRQKKDLERPFDALILPGGESTVMAKLMREDGLYEPLLAKIQAGLPVYGTCAGLILLAREVEGGTPAFGTMNIRALRNAYGRQLGSFSVDEQIEGIGTFPMRFIRAPYIEKVLDDTKVLAKVDGNIVMVENKNQFAMSFHPELTSDTRIHEMFLKKI